MVQTKKLSVYNDAKMIAHMGARGLEPENTIPAFFASANRTYYGIETDVHITKDKRVIVTHDDNAVRVSGVDINIEESTFEELRKVKLYDSDGESTKDYLFMPSLEEYISICKKYGKIAVLELKNRMADEDVYMIYDIIEQLGYNKGTLYISFAIDNLHAIRRKNPTQPVQYLVGKNVEDDLFDKLRAYRYDLDIYFENVTKELIDACHELGVAVNAWTVNEVDFAEKLVNMGIDYITTDILE